MSLKDETAEALRLQKKLEHATSMAEAKEIYRREREPKDEETGVNPKDLIGVKKPRVDLVPGAGILRTAAVMELGAEKYGPYNWRKYKVKYTVYLAAAMRHLMAALDGQEFDPESGQLHAAHAAACMMIVIDAHDSGQLEYDLPTPGPAAEVIKVLTKD